QQYREGMQVGNRRRERLVAQDLRGHERSRALDLCLRPVDTDVVDVDDGGLARDGIDPQVPEADVPVAQPGGVQRGERVDQLAADGGDDPERGLYLLVEQLRQRDETRFEQRD